MMSSLNAIFVIVLMFLCNICQSQNSDIITEGKITYEKTLYLRNILKKKFVEKADPVTKPQFERIQSSVPEKVTLTKELLFAEGKTDFHPGKDNVIEPKTKSLIEMLALDFGSTTIMDVQKNEFKRFSQFMGDKFVIYDTLKKVKWKITDEYRDIAGYRCRRANGLTSDSLYIVAYYCYEIPIASGPESITGLPGLVMGLISPEQHFSLFAKEVDKIPPIVIREPEGFASKKIVSRNEVTSYFKNSLGKMMNQDTFNYIIGLLHF